MLSAITRLVLLPVFIFGFLNNYLPYWFTASKSKNIKDTQFQSSFKYVIGMIVFPVWYIALAGILAFMSLPIRLILLYIVLLPLTGLAAFDYYIRFKKLVAKCRYNNMKSSREMNILRNVRKSIFKKMHNIINMQKPANDIDG
jgi:fatty acid desaturase